MGWLRSQDIQAEVDRVLATHGAYIPVELLLALGQLRYIDYQAWRYGNQPSLQFVLEANARDVVDVLTQAPDWARAIGLRPEAHDYLSWGSCARHRLVFFHGSSDEAEAALATHYVRPAQPATGDQLDLFFDNGTAVALQDLQNALRTRDSEAADRCLATLIAKEPEHYLRPAARQLIDALANLPSPLASEQVEAELAALEQTLLPAARAVLGSGTRDLMAVFWQRLAAALVNVPFDPERPALHASYAYVQCLDWRQAMATIEAVPDYAAHPVLLARLAQARYHAGEYNGAIAAWCMLCWCSGSTAEKALNELPPSATKLREAWIDFRDFDLDPAPATGLFPARLLLAEPGLARALAPDLAAGDSAGRHAFRAVRQLLQQDCIDTRKAVRKAAPWLLEAYLHLRIPG